MITGKGGYQILNLDGSYTEGVATIKGIYGKTMQNKAILLQGGGFRTQFIPAGEVGDGSITFTVGGKTVTITNEDVVTIADAE